MVLSVSMKVTNFHGDSNDVVTVALPPAHPNVCDVPARPVPVPRCQDTPQASYVCTTTHKLPCSPTLPVKRSDEACKLK